MRNTFDLFLIYFRLEIILDMIDEMFQRMSHFEIFFFIEERQIRNLMLGTFKFEVFLILQLKKV